MERTDLNKTKTGVFTGAYAINPVNGQEIPVWISDYVIAGYGTGAIMAVPGHDERDFEFAKKFGLPIVYVYKPDLKEHPELIPDDVNAKGFKEEDLEGLRCLPEDGICIRSENKEISLNGLNQDEATKKIIAWLEKKGIGKGVVTYKLRDWLFSRQRYWGEPFPILHFADGTKRVLGVDELPLLLPPVTNYKPSGDGQSPLSKVNEWVEYCGSKNRQKSPKRN